MPDYEVSTAVEVPDPVPLVPRVVPPARVPLLIGTSAAAVATGIVYGLAGNAEARFKSPATPDASLARLEKTANTLVVVSGVTGVVTVGLGIGLATTF